MVQIAKDTGLRVNEKIPSWGSCRLIDEEGTQLGIFGVEAALNKAYDLGLDLVEISPNADPPVCRIMDYSKYKYERQKKEKENRKNSKQQQLKEMKFRCRIGDGDYETKKKHVIRFLEGGSNVRITIMFRGREMSHPDIGLEILDRLIEDLSDIAAVLAKPKMEGRNMTMTLAPIDAGKQGKQRKDKKEKKESSK